MSKGCIGLLLLLANVQCTCCLELSWIQYSDRASLPQSLHAREELRSSLNLVNLGKLTVAQKKQVKQLKQLLDEVLVESQREAEADARTPGILRLGGPFAVANLRLQDVALLALLLCLGFCVFRLSKPVVVARQAQAADVAASREADGIVAAEQSQVEGKPVLRAVAAGQFFPNDIAQALCRRLVTIHMQFHDSNKKAEKKSGKEAQLQPLLIDTRQLGMLLPQYYEMPEVEVVDKALRKERKKLRQAVQALEKTVEEAALVADQAAARARALGDVQKKAEDAKAVADAKKGPKKTTKTNDVIDSTKFAENAQKAAAVRETDVQKARQAVEVAKVDEGRPKALFKMECAWLSAVTETWSKLAIKKGGAPTSSHMHAWARDPSLRQNTVQSYTEIVSQKGFLD